MPLCFNLYSLYYWTHGYIFIYFLGYAKFPFESFVHFCVFPYFLIELLGVFRFIKLLMNRLKLRSQSFQFFLHIVVPLVEFFSDLVSFLQSQCWMYQLCPVGGTHSNVSPWAYKDRPEPLYLWWVFSQGKCLMAYSCFLSYRLISVLHAVSGIRAMVDAALHLETQLTTSLLFCCFSSFLLWEMPGHLASLLVPPWRWVRLRTLSSVFLLHPFYTIITVLLQCIQSISILKKE